MAFWRTFTLGDGTLWGDLAYGTSPNIRYGISIDWDGDGSFNGVNEADHLLSWNSNRGRSFFLNSSGDGLEPVNEGRLTLTLDNQDGRYDPFNTSSPLYPNILPGRKIQFIVMETDTLTQHYVFTGEIDDIRPFANEKTVTITAVDGMRKLKEQETTIALNASIKVSDAIEAILDSVNYTDYAIDSLLDIISYWWVNQEKASEAIQKLCDASFGTFFIAADGKAKYYTRSKAVSSVLTLTQDLLLKDMVINQPWDVVRNNIDVIVNPLVLESTADLWTLRDVPSVAAGASIEIWGSFTNYLNQSCAATNVLSPVATTDYLMNTVSGGGGTNLTASFTVTVSIFGESVKFTITNNSGSTGYINLLKIRGDALSNPDPVRINKVDAASVAIYKNRTFKLDSKWLQNTNLGITLADTIKGLLSSARKYPVIRIDTRPDIQYSVDLFDRISLTLTKLGLDSAYRIGNITHESTSPTCQTVLTTLTLEPVVDVSDVYWVFPVLIGTETYFA